MILLAGVTTAFGASIPLAAADVHQIIPLESLSLRPELTGGPAIAAGADHGFIVVWYGGPLTDQGPTIYYRRFDLEGQPLDPVVKHLGAGYVEHAVWSGTDWLVFSGSSVMRVPPAGDQVETMAQFSWWNVLGVASLPNRLVLLTRTNQHALIATFFDSQGRLLFTRHVAHLEGREARAITVGHRMIALLHDPATGAIDAVEIDNHGTVSDPTPLAAIEPGAQLRAVSTGDSFIVVSSLPGRLRSRGYDADLQPAAGPHDLGGGTIAFLATAGDHYVMVVNHGSTVRIATRLDDRGTPIESWSLQSSVSQLVAVGARWLTVSPFGAGVTGTLYNERFEPIEESIPVSIGVPWHNRPAAAALGSQALLVWTERLSFSRDLVRMARIDSTGRLVGEPQPVGTTTRQHPVRLAASHTSWLVAWYDDQLNRVSGIRVGIDGVRIDTVPIDLGSDLPAVASDGDRFFLVAPERLNDSRLISGTTLEASGARDLTAHFSFEAEAGEIAAAANGERLIVVWNEPITCQTACNPPTPLHYALIPSKGSGAVRHPLNAAGRSISAASGASGTLIAWSDGVALRAERIDPTGARLILTGGAVLHPQVRGWESARIVPVATGWLIAPSSEPLLIEVDEQLQLQRLRQAAPPGSEEMTIAASAELAPLTIFRHRLDDPSLFGAWRLHASPGVAEREEIDLSLELIPGSFVAPQPAEATFRLVVRNHSDLPAEDVTVLIRGNTGAIETGGDWSCSIQRVCSLLEPLEPGAARELAGRFRTTTGSELVASLSAAQWDANPEDNFVSASVTPPAPARRRGARP